MKVNKKGRLGMEYFKKYRIFYLNPVQISIGECVQQG